MLLGWLKRILFVLLVLILGSLWVFCFFQTGLGHDILEKNLNRWLVWSEGRVVVAGISGLFPVDFQLGRIEIHDSDGAWLVFEDARLQWSIQQLLVARTLHIEAVEADRVDFKRLPAGRLEVETANGFKLPESITWKWPLPRLRIECLQIRKLLLPDELMRGGGEFSLQARGRADSAGFVLPHAYLQRLDCDGSRIRIRSVWRDSLSYLGLLVDISDRHSLAQIFESRLWPESIALRLQGQGQLANWNGRLKVDGGAMVRAEFELSTQAVEQEIRLLLDGDFKLDQELLNSRLASYLDPVWSLRLELAANPGREILSGDINLDSEYVNLASRVLLDLDDTRFNGSVHLLAADLAPLLEPLGLALTDPFQLRLSGGGSFSSMELELESELGGLTAPGLAVEQARLAGDFKFSPESPETRLNFDGDLVLSGIAIDSYSEGPDEMRVSLAAELAAGRLLIVDQLMAKAESQSVMFSGSLELPEARLAGAVIADLPGFGKRLPKTVGMAEMDGDLTLHGLVQGELRDGRYSLVSQTGLSQFSLADSRLSEFAGEKPHLNSSLDYAAETGLTASELNLILAEGEFSGSGELALKAGNFFFLGDLELPDLAWMEPFAGYPKGGQAELWLQGKGDFARPEFRLEMAAAGVRMATFPLLDIEAVLELGLGEEKAFGKAGVDLAWEQDKLASEFAFSMVEESLELTGISALGAGISLTGDLHLRPAARLMTGSLVAHVTDLSGPGAFLGIPLDGEARAELDLTEGNDQEQSLSGFLIGKDIVFEKFSLADFRLDARFDDLFDRLAMQAELQVTDGRLEDWLLSSARLELSGQPDEFDFSSEIIGRVKHDFKLDLDGVYTENREQRSLQVNGWQGNFAGFPFELEEPVRLRQSPEEMVMTPLTMGLGDGSIVAEVIWRDEKIAGDLQLSDLSLAGLPLPLEFGLDGRIGIGIELRGTAEAPEVTGRLLLDNLTHTEIGHEQIATWAAELEWRAADGRVDLSTSVREDNQSVLQGEMVIPLDYSLAPPGFSLPSPIPLQGSLKGELNIQAGMANLLPPEHVLRGLLQFDLNFDGDDQEPLLQGGIELVDGYYEHLETSLILVDLELMMQAEKNQLRLVSLKAGDGQGGRLLGEGMLNLVNLSELQWSAELELNNFRLLRHYLATADVAKGELDLSGDRHQGKLGGRLEFQRIEARVADPPPATELDRLPIREVNLPDHRRPTEAEEEAEETESPGFPLDLELELIFPARVFVRGRGIDSEWHGRLLIVGTAATPRLEGSLELLRGSMVFMDSRFTLDRGSFVNFDGSLPIDPLFDVLAHYQRRNQRIGLRVHGTASSPEFELFSDPVMPQDEILARLIFGRSVAALTPLQALRLLNATATLVRGEPGLDVMGRVRSLLGVDDLEIAPDPDDRGTQLGLGKYVHERVYLQLRTGLGPGRESVLVEVELHPLISLESRLGTDREGGLGLFWRYSY